MDQEPELALMDLLTPDGVPNTLASARAVPESWLRVLEDVAALFPALVERPLTEAVPAMIAEIDLCVTEALNAILHKSEFQELEASWRGLHRLVRNTETGPYLKIKVLCIGKAELARTLRKYRGAAWDQSPIFRKIYEEQYGQLGGEPYGVLLGDYAFDYRQEDVLLLSSMAQIGAAAHVPFIASAAPSLMQMDNWLELANPRDLTRIFETPEYVAWRSLRQDEDSRYLALCLPRMLGRLPYGHRTDPQDRLAFEEDVETAGTDAFLWVNPAYAMGSNIARAFYLYGWCTRIRGVDRGGMVDDIPVLTFATADGDTDRRCVTEITLSERREAELASVGLIPLVHRKNTDFACFVSCQSLQRPVVYDDDAATANAIVAARLPYLLACCRFAHYLKCMVRDKVGSTMSRAQVQSWLMSWLMTYVDGSPETSSDAFKASHPLLEAGVVLQDLPEQPGHYEAKVYLRPHFQMEGMTVALRLVSKVPS